MTQMLVVRCADAAQVTVFRSNNGTLIQIGNPFTPTTSMLTDAASLSKACLACQFGSNLYCVVGGDVRKFNPTTQNWVSETLPAFTLANVQQHSGFFVGRSSTGVPRLLLLLVVAGPNYRALYLEGGGSWALGTLGPVANVGTSGFLGKPCQFRGSFRFANARDLVSYRSSEDTWHVQTLGGAGATHLDVAFARCKGRLFAARTATGGADEYINIYEYVGGTWALVVDGSATTPLLARTDASGRPASTSGWALLHYDEAADALILHAYQDRGGGSRGWRCFQIAATNFAVTDRTSLVPAPLQYPTGPDISPSSYSVHFQFQLQNEVTPGTPIQTIWVEVNDGAWSSFRWNGVSSSITDATGSQGDRGMALPEIQQGGGEYIYDGSTTANPAIHLEEAQARVAISPTATRVVFKGYTYQDDLTGASPASASRNVALWYATAQQGPKLQATLVAVGKLSGAAATPTLSGNAAVGVTFDGSSVFYADWNGIGDGLVDQQAHLAFLRTQ